MNERLEKGKVWLKEHWKDVLRVALVLAIVLVIVFHYEDLEDLDVRGLVEMAPSVWLAALIAILIYAVKGAVMVIPASLVYLSIGVAFETWQAIIINIVGIFVELSVSYLVGRFVGGERVEKLLAKKPKVEAALEGKSNATGAGIFVLHFSSLPIDIVSMFFGSTGYSYPRFLFWSALGVLPRVIFMTALGDAAYNYIPFLSA